MPLVVRMPVVRGGLLVIAEGEEYLFENLCFPRVLNPDFPPRQVDARGSAEVCSL